MTQRDGSRRLMKACVETLEERRLLTGTLVPVTGVNDLVYDARRGDLCMTTSGGKVVRYDLATGTLLPEITAGVNLKGADITPDGKYLYAVDGGANAVRKVDLDSGQVTSIFYTPGYSEDYGWDLKILSDGYAYFTGQFRGSGWVEFRRIKLSDDSVGPAPVGGLMSSSLRQNTPLARSADYSTLFWQESNTSSGPIALYDAASDSIISSRDTSWFVGYDAAAVNRNGSLVVMHLTDYTVLDRGLGTVWTLSNVTGSYRFDPNRDLLYTMETGGDLVAYDTNTWQEQLRVALGEDVAATRRPLASMEVSSDSRYLFVVKSGGVQVVPVFLHAGPIADVSTYAYQRYTLHGSGERAPGQSVTYEWDLDYDGSTFDVDRTGADVTATAPDVDATMTRTIAFRVHASDGQVSNVATATLTIEPVSVLWTQWQPMGPGLSFVQRGYERDKGLYDGTAEYRSDGEGGLIEITEERSPIAATQGSTDHLVKVGTTWYLTSMQTSEDGVAGPTTMPSQPLPFWDEAIAAGQVLSWSGITIPTADLGELIPTGPSVAKGSTRRVRTGSITLSDGTRFENALLVRSTMTTTVPIAADNRTGRITSTSTFYEWRVRGVGVVRSDSRISASARLGSRSASHTERGWQELAELPDWAKFAVVSDGTLQFRGTDGADRIRISVAGTDLLVYRNGVPNRVPLASVQRIVIHAGGGDDLVDVRSVAVPVEIAGGTGNDSLYGGVAGDTLDGGEGDDRIYGYSGADVLRGGNGNDRMYGGSESDSLTGGAGLDLLQGQSGDDWIDGHDDLLTDKISGGAGVDRAYVDAREKAGSVETRVEEAAPSLLASGADLDLAAVERELL